MFCDEFLDKDVSDCKQFVIDQKLCFKCLSKNNHIKDCISGFTCCHELSDKNHQTILHKDKKPMPNSNSPANSNNENTVQIAPQHDSINTDKNP